MVRHSVHKQLRAIRATVASVIAQLDAVEDALGRGGCVHPEEDRKAIGSMEAPDRFLCGRCGAIGGEPQKEEA
jgi:hypothetical protein